jgi:hypothetical protein
VTFLKYILKMEVWNVADLTAAQKYNSNKEIAKIQIEDMVIFAWNWKIREYPVWYGVRLLH